MYTQSITRSHRTAFILAIDQSGSMAEKLLFRGRQTTKAEAVAEVTNRLLFELIERARRSDEVRDYYDIAVLGYSGDGIVSLLNDPEPLVPVSRLAALPVDFAETVVERRMPDVAWIKKSELLKLRLWEGDKIFLRLLDTDEPFFSLKLKYEGDTLVLAQLNGAPLEVGR